MIVPVFSGALKSGIRGRYRLATISAVVFNSRHGQDPQGSVDRLKRFGIQRNDSLGMTCLASGILLAWHLPVLAQTGDVPDGSRARYVHVIPLYPEDKDGDKGG